MGKSCHGAPVRKIQRTPLSTAWVSFHGLPRPSSLTCSCSSGSNTFHCASVRSMLVLAETSDQSLSFYDTCRGVKSTCFIYSPIYEMGSSNLHLQGLTFANHTWAVHAAVDANCLVAWNTDAFWSFVDQIHGNQGAINTERPRGPCRRAA